MCLKNENYYYTGIDVTYIKKSRKLLYLTIIVSTFKFFNNAAKSADKYTQFLLLSRTATPIRCEIGLSPS